MSDMHDLDELARRQFGLISRAQALKVLSVDGIRWRLERGEWEHLRKGVYRFRAVPSTWSQFAMGVVLAAGEQSALSHQTAAFLYKLDGFTREAPTILDVTSSDRQLTAASVRFHRSRCGELPVKTVSGLTVTSLSRTLVDLATVIRPDQLDIALDSARRSNPLLPDELKACLKLRDTRPRVLHLKQLLASRLSPLDSPKEVDMLKLIRERGLPEPIAGFSVYDLKKFIMKIDFAWPDRLVALHFDSYRYHHHRVRFERDARQRTQLAGAKWQSVIVTDRSLESHDWSNALKRLLSQPSIAHR